MENDNDLSKPKSAFGLRIIQSAVEYVDPDIKLIKENTAVSLRKARHRQQRAGRYNLIISI